MSDWRSRILDEFPPQAMNVTIAIDPDCLLLEEKVLKALRNRGFELLSFEDNISFRYIYESRFRSKWDNKENLDSCVIVHFKTSELSKIPFDLSQSAHSLSISLVDIFPNLSYPIVSALVTSDLDDLWQAQELQKPSRLGDNATKDFILRHVFGISPEYIKTAADLLKVLLRRHYRNQPLPAILDERLIEALRQTGRFSEWPLEKIVPDRQAFLYFLQERWPIFLNQFIESSSEVREPSLISYNLKYSGPVKLPFDDADVRVYVDNLFGEELLHPIEPPAPLTLKDTWIIAGVKSDPKTSQLKRLNRLLETVESTIPPIDGKYRDWLQFVYSWGELNSLRLDIGMDVISTEMLTRLNKLQTTVDFNFLGWIENSYSSLHNQPGIPPVMVHHIPRALARQLENRECKKAALIVVDGLAIEQWIVIRNALQSQFPNLHLHESACFAWAPTITSITRQAIFAGKAPIYFPGSINTTEKESALWTSFWINYGLSTGEISYLKLQEEHEIDTLSEVIINPNIKVLGIVITKIDKIMHGMELGAIGMHNLVKQWANQAFLPRILEALKSHNYSIVLTSDHGNIEAEGMGCPSEGVLAELRGERVRVYLDSTLRSKIKEQFPGTIEWPPIGIPEALMPLFAPARFAFITEHHKTIAHGGICLEELIVPLVRIE